MNTRYKNYKFAIEETLDKHTLEVYQSIKVYNKNVDEEILLLSLHGGGNFTLYLQDRFFTLTIDDETKRISSFDGELTNKQIQISKLDLPTTIKDAVLTLDTSDELYPGTGSYIKFDTKNIIYDKEQKVLQIGNIDSKNIIYKIFSNGYAQIKNGELSGLMFTEMQL